MAPGGGCVSDAPGAMLDKLGQGDFEARRGEAFRLTLPGVVVVLELIEVTAHPYLPPDPNRRRGFSLLFRGGGPGHVPQGTYRLENQAMGTLDLFLVPLGPRDGAMAYEAVFN
jgi:hypothetical protein